MENHFVSYNCKPSKIKPLRSLYVASYQSIHLFILVCWVILWSIHLIWNSNGQRKEDKKEETPLSCPFGPAAPSLAACALPTSPWPTPAPPHPGPASQPRAPQPHSRSPTCRPSCGPARRSPTRPKPLLARLARACALASRYRRHALRRCAPVGPCTRALRAPCGFVLHGSVLPCLSRAWAVAQRRRCRGTHLPSLSFLSYLPAPPEQHGLIFFSARGTGEGRMAEHGGGQNGRLLLPS
jgi:hypothetical protein